jgi:hypothetical protein
MQANHKERLAAFMGGLIIINQAVPALFQDAITMAASI